MARFHQQFYVFDDARPVPVIIRSYTEADFDELIVIQSETFPPRIRRSSGGTRSD